MDDTHLPGRINGVLKDHLLVVVPVYANRIFYSIGFLSMVSLVWLILTGMVLVFWGPNWWLTTAWGLFTRSLHLWAAQAFIFFIFLHALIVFLTGAYKPPRRLTWVLGALMLFLAMFEAEFGYGLRGDFSSQWRSLQAADFYNGTGLGMIINNLNYAQIYGIHIVIIPLIIIVLLTAHYFLIRVMGIARPQNVESAYPLVKANHTVLLFRGLVLTAVLILLAKIFPSPLIIPTTIQSVAKTAPTLVAKTLVAEMAHSSATATYLDNIDPYTFDTRTVYIKIPYGQYLQLTGNPDAFSVFAGESSDVQKTQLAQAQNYYTTATTLADPSAGANPVYSVVSSLVKMAQAGIYEESLANQNTNAFNVTAARRFLSDTGVLEVKAEDLHITTDQYGMMREEQGYLPGAWWLVPIGVFNHTILANDPNGDRDGAEILAAMMFLLLAFPFIPVVNRIPEFLHLDRFIWGPPQLPKNPPPITENQPAP